MKCIRCQTELIQDPERRHWQHCPNCDAVWATHARRLTRLLSLDSIAQSSIRDTRGRPTIGGSRS